jgi:hypothetical protein
MQVLYFTLLIIWALVVGADFPSALSDFSSPEWRGLRGLGILSSLTYFSS